MMIRESIHTDRFIYRPPTTGSQMSGSKLYQFLIAVHLCSILLSRFRALRLSLVPCFQLTGSLTVSETSVQMTTCAAIHLLNNKVFLYFSSNFQ